jgi:hypothetical protein
MLRKPKKILTVYRFKDRLYIALGEKEYIVRVCYEDIIECVTRALSDYSLVEYVEYLEGD